MKDLQFLNGDLAVVNHDLVEISGLDRVVQSCQIRLRTFLGEWFLDTTLGVPYFTDIFVKSPDLDSINSMLQAIIIDDPEITGIVPGSYTSNYNGQTRAFSVNFTVTTIYGNAQVQV